MHALLISSDSVISSKRKILKSPVVDFSSSVKKLLIINNEETEDSHIYSETSRTDLE